MHYSLTRRANLALAVLWLVMLSAVVIAAKGMSLAVVAGCGVAGVIAGRLQDRALRQEKERFLKTSSAREVRAVLTSVLPGRLSIYVLWTTAAALFLTIILVGSALSWGTPIGGYAAFALMRDLAALPAIFSFPQDI